MAKVLVVDDDPRYYEPLIDRALNEYDIELIVKDNWEDAENHVADHFNEYDAIILDAKGKVDSDCEGDDLFHLKLALKYLDKISGAGEYIPRYINTAYFEGLNKEYRDEKIYAKNSQEDQLFKDLLAEIDKNEVKKLKNRYPDVFACFGGDYLDRKYERSLINIVSILEDGNLRDSENLLFNPCRILLEAVFKEVTSINERILPYAISNFEKQKPGLVNCSKYLNGQKVYIDGQQYSRAKFLSEHISQQIQTIIGICHPASHDIQDNYTKYTFKSVLWAIFDVLIWLKKFADDNNQSATKGCLRK